MSNQQPKGSLTSQRLFLTILKSCLILDSKILDEWLNPVSSISTDQRLLLESTLWTIPCESIFASYSRSMGLSNGDCVALSLFDALHFNNENFHQMVQPCKAKAILFQFL
jgi:hypothetical protein